MSNATKNSWNIGNHITLKSWHYGLVVRGKCLMQGVDEGCNFDFTGVRGYVFNSAESKL